MKIKICGIYRNEDAENVNKVLCDYTGFVFFEKSHRNVTEKKAAELRNIIKNEIPVVGVFVNEDIKKIAAIFYKNIINIIQLHGNEDELYIQSLRKTLPKAEIWKAFKINSKEDIKKAQESTADMILLDNGYGTGECFDWSLIKEIERKFILAGGLTPENIYEAGKILNPYMIDISSGVEINKKKDFEKMKKAVLAARKV